MGLTILISEYIAWHYGRAPTEILELGRNFLWFGWNVFSVELLSKTLFAPFYRIQEGYKNWTDFEALGETIVANTVSRAVGFLLRIFIIAAGFLFETIICIAMVMALTAWILFPIFIPFLIFSGIYLLF
ncbi:MAG: hypothetical protein HYT98_04620 [Candidatus Sungbacteria bacterium]|nr:hypothetical protein [Candidatus Sungbacteria bacterium]